MYKWKTHCAAASMVLLLFSTVSAGPTYSFTNSINANPGNPSHGQFKPSLDLLVLGQGYVAYNSLTNQEVDTGQTGSVIVGTGWTPFSGQGPAGGPSVSGTSRNSWRSTSRYGVAPTGFSPSRAFHKNSDSPFGWNANQPTSAGMSFFSGYQGSSSSGVSGTPTPYGFRRTWKGFDFDPTSEFCPGFKEPPPPTAAVPTPGSILLGGIGIGMVGLLRNRKNSALQ